jgi:hypothetical protein
LFKVIIIIVFITLFRIRRDGQQQFVLQHIRIMNPEEKLESSSKLFYLPPITWNPNDVFPHNYYDLLQPLPPISSIM